MRWVFISLFVRRKNIKSISQKINSDYMKTKACLMILLALLLIFTTFTIVKSQNNNKFIEIDHISNKIKTGNIVWQINKSYITKYIDIKITEINETCFLIQTKPTDYLLQMYSDSLTLNPNEFRQKYPRETEEANERGRNIIADMRTIDKIPFGSMNGFTLGKIAKSNQGGTFSGLEENSFEICGERKQGNYIKFGFGSTIITIVNATFEITIDPATETCLTDCRHEIIIYNNDTIPHTISIDNITVENTDEMTNITFYYIAYENATIEIPIYENVTEYYLNVTGSICQDDNATNCFYYNDTHCGCNTTVVSGFYTENVTIEVTKNFTSYTIEPKETFRLIIKYTVPMGSSGKYNITFLFNNEYYNVDPWYYSYLPHRIYINYTELYGLNYTGAMVFEFNTSTWEHKPSIINWSENCTVMGDVNNLPCWTDIKIVDRYGNELAVSLLYAEVNDTCNTGDSCYLEYFQIAFNISIESYSKNYSVMYFGNQSVSKPLYSLGEYPMFEYVFPASHAGIKYSSYSSGDHSDRFYVASYGNFSGRVYRFGIGYTVMTPTDIGNYIVIENIDNYPNGTIAYLTRPAVTWHHRQWNNYYEKGDGCFQTEGIPKSWAGYDFVLPYATGTVDIDLLYITSWEDGNTVYLYNQSWDLNATYNLDKGETIRYNGVSPLFRINSTKPISVSYVRDDITTAQPANSLGYSLLPVSMWQQGRYFIYKQGRYDKESVYVVTMADAVNVSLFSGNGVYKKSYILSKQQQLEIPKTDFDSGDYILANDTIFAVLIFTDISGDYTQEGATGAMLLPENYTGKMFHLHNGLSTGLLVKIGEFDDTMVNATDRYYNNYQYYLNTGSVDTNKISNWFRMFANNSFCLGVQTWCEDEGLHTRALSKIPTIKYNVLDYEVYGLETIVTDTTPPTLTFVSPTPENNSFLNQSWIYINVSANENLDTCILDMNNVNYTMTVVGTYCYINKTGLSDGSYYFRVYGNDTAGNMNVTEDREVTIDTTSPIVTIYSPQNTTYTTTSIDLNYTAKDTNLDSCWYSLNGGSNVILVSCSNTTITAIEGLNNVIVYANDTAGNIGSAQVYFTVDTAPPQLNFVTPTLDNQSYTNNNWIYINVSSNEQLDTCLLDMNGVNYTMTVVGTYCYINKTGLSDGTYYFRVYGNDTAGNMNVTEDRQITVDTISPTVTIYSPQNITYTTTTINLDVSADESVDTWWYSLNGGSNVIFTPNTTITASQGLNNIIVYANDSAGNIGSAQVYFTVDSIVPPLDFVSPTPANQSTVTDDWIFVNVSSNEALDTCILDWNGVNETMTVVGTYCYINKTNLADGTYYFRVYGNDTAGNMNVTEDRQVTVEKYPEISGESFNTSFFNGTQAVNFSFTITPTTYIDKCWAEYEKEDGSKQNITGTLTGSLCNVILTVDQIGDFYATAWTNTTTGVYVNGTTLHGVRVYTALGDWISDPSRISEHNSTAYITKIMIANNSLGSIDAINIPTYADTRTGWTCVKDYYVNIPAGVDTTYQVVNCSKDGVIFGYFNDSVLESEYNEIVVKTPYHGTNATGYITLISNNTDDLVTIDVFFNTTKISGWYNLTPYEQFVSTPPNSIVVSYVNYTKETVYEDSFTPIYQSGGIEPELTENAYFAFIVVEDDGFNITKNCPIRYKIPISRLYEFGLRVGDIEAYVNGSSQDVTATVNGDYVDILVGTSHSSSSLEPGLYEFKLVYYTAGLTGSSLPGTGGAGGAAPEVIGVPAIPEAVEKIAFDIVPREIILQSIPLDDETVQMTVVNNEDVEISVIFELLGESPELGSISNQTIQVPPHSSVYVYVTSTMPEQIGVQKSYVIRAKVMKGSIINLKEIGVNVTAIEGKPLGWFCDRDEECLSLNCVDRRCVPEGVTAPTPSITGGIIAFIMKNIYIIIAILAIALLILWLVK